MGVRHSTGIPSSSPYPSTAVLLFIKADLSPDSATILSKRKESVQIQKHSGIQTVGWENVAEKAAGFTHPPFFVHILPFPHQSSLLS